VSKDGVAMVRRSLVLMAVMGMTVLLVAGCQNLRQAIRSASNEPPQTLKSGKPGGVEETSAVETDPTKILSVDSDAKNQQPFFKNNRRSGTWSSEAREIESHLGVGP
jgi:hypothetical protein